MPGTFIPWSWGALGLVLGIVEILAPGYFLAFPAFGCFAACVATLAAGANFDGTIWGNGLAVFGLATLAGLLLFSRGYRGLLAKTAANLVNDPDRMVGARATVEEAISGGRGKVRMGDTLWLASGPDLAAGRPVRVTAVDGTVLRIEPAD